MKPATRRGRQMLIPTIILGVLAIGLTVWVYTRGGDVSGPLKGAGLQVLTMVPLLFFAMLLAGVVQQVIPQEAISGWLFGQVMQASKGKANPQVVRKELEQQLSKLAQSK